MRPYYLALVIALAPVVGVFALPVPVAAQPSAERLAAVRAINKPSTGDPGEDEYTYGLLLREAKLFGEAEQVLWAVVAKYPGHARVSDARYLLGRAYLDDAKPRDAATWFLQNYISNKTGERAADSLLYLAESMRQLRDTSRSCIALDEFATNFPREAAGRLRGQYDETRRGLSCLTRLAAPSPDTITQPQASSDIDDAKKKCADLGFVRGTLKFGQCVLKVSE